MCISSQQFSFFILQVTKTGTKKPQSTTQNTRQKTPPRQSGASSGYTTGGQGFKATADEGQESGWGSSGWGDSDDWGTTGEYLKHLSRTDHFFQLVVGMSTYPVGCGAPVKLHHARKTSRDNAFTSPEKN